MNQFYTTLSFTFLTFLLIVSCSTTQETAIPDESAEIHETVNSLIVQMPVSGMDEQLWLNEQLTETGAYGVRVLAGMLVPPGAGDDTHARYALSSLAVHVSRPGAESERSVFEQALLSELGNDHSMAVKAFLIDQLELTAGSLSVPVMQGFLADDRLYHHAINILVTLGSQEAAESIRREISRSDGPRRAALIKALGDLRDTEALNDLITLASDEDWPTRRAALYALSRSIHPAAEHALSEAADTTGSHRQTEVQSYLLAYTAGLAAQGEYSAASQISRNILEGDYPDQVKSSAVSILIDTEGERAVEELLELAVSSDKRLRISVLQQINELPGQDVTNALMDALQSGSPQVQEDIIRILGKRGDKSVLSDVKHYLENSSPESRIAAAEAVYELEGDDSLNVLVDVLSQAEGEKEIKAIESILLQTPTEDLVASSAAALPEAADTAKPAFIRILNSRNDGGHLDLIREYGTHEDEQVRLEVYRAFETFGNLEDLPVLAGFLSADREEDEISAIQFALVATAVKAEDSEEMDEMVSRIFREADDSEKPFLLAILPYLESDETLRIVVEALGHSDEDIRSAAVISLAGWPEPYALPHLLEASAGASVSEREVLVNGYLRLVNQSGESASEKADMLVEITETAQSPGEKEEIIRSFSQLDPLAALQASARFFQSDEEAVRDSGLLVASEILGPYYENGPSTLNSSTAFMALLDDSDRTALQEYLQRKPEESEDTDTEDPDNSDPDQQPGKFGTLFNGENLEGWEAVGTNPDGWGVEDGILYTDGVGSGWLSTTSTYDNFRLELEYRVPEEGNSGVFLRATREGNPAYQGMEIQILDDYADRYSELQPWQYTGSIYDVKGPSKRKTKQAGEWQSMTIVADGPNIKVTLNGEMVLNTSLVHYMDLVNRHPGLTRREGYIGLQNHSNRVEFRNIIISKID